MAVHPKTLLERWLQAHHAQLREAEIDSSLEEAVSGGSARIDFASKSSLGRVTVWPEGFCDAEVLDLETDEHPYHSHREELTPDLLAVLMNELVERLSRASH